MQRQFRCQLEHPGPAIGPLEPLRRGPGQVGTLAANPLGNQVCVEQGADRGGVRQGREAPVQVRQHPVAVHAGMPVEAAVEHRMQLAWAACVHWAGQHVVQLVGVFSTDMPEGDRRKSVSEVRCHRRQARHCIRNGHANEVSQAGRDAPITEPGRQARQIICPHKVDAPAGSGVWKTSPVHPPATLSWRGIAMDALSRIHKILTPARRHGATRWKLADHDQTVPHCLLQP